MNPFLWAMTIAGGLTALLTLFRLSLSIARLVAKLDEAMPVLLDIASSFTNPTLKARMETVESKVDGVADQVSELHDYTHTWRHQLSNDMQKVLLKLDVRRGDKP